METVLIKALKGAIEHGSVYIVKGGTGAIPADIAKGLVKTGKAAYVNKTDAKTS